MYDLLPPANPVIIDERSTDSALVLGRGALVGINCLEPTNAAGTEFVLRDGGAATGPLLGSFTLAQNESRHDAPVLPGIRFERGVFLDLRTGSVEGVIYVITQDMVDPDVFANWWYGGLRRPR